MKKETHSGPPADRRRVISLLVDNQNGVLARVSSLFCRRGFNIDSLTVSATNDPAVSRIPVATHGKDQEIEQLILQTARLEVARQVFELNADNSLQRELLLLKVACSTANRAELREHVLTRCSLMKVLARWIAKRWIPPLMRWMP